MTSEASWSRRSLLRGALSLPLVAASAANAGAANAADAPERLPVVEPPVPSPESIRLWLALRGRLDGKPVFWLARGTEYVSVDGVVTPYNGRVIAVVSLTRDLGGGRYDLPYLETIGSVTTTGYAFAADHRHPITGDPISTVVSEPLALGLQLSGDGRLTQKVTAKDGTRVEYRGYLWESPGLGTERTAISKVDVHLHRPDGSLETLAEINALRSLPGARATRGFLPAEGVTTTSRNVANPTRLGGRVAFTIGSYQSRKCRSIDALRRLMRPIEVTKHQALFDAWAEWVGKTG